MNLLKNSFDVETLDGFEIGKEGQGWKGGREKNLWEVDTIVLPDLYKIGFEISLEHKDDNMFLLNPIGRKDIAIDIMIYCVPSIEKVHGKLQHSIPHSIVKITKMGEERISFMLKHNLKDCYILIVVHRDFYLLLKDTHFPPSDWYLTKRREKGDRMHLKGDRLIDSFVNTNLNELKDELNTIFKTVKRYANK